MKSLTTLSQYLTKGKTPDDRDLHGLEFAFQEDENNARFIAEQRRLAEAAPVDPGVSDGGARFRPMPMQPDAATAAPDDPQSRADRDTNWRAQT